MAVTESEEVLVASRVSVAQMRSSWPKSERLVARSSTTASTTSRAAATSPRSSTGRTRASASSRPAWVSFPLATSLASPAPIC